MSLIAVIKKIELFLRETIVVSGEHCLYLGVSDMLFKTEISRWDPEKIARLLKDFEQEPGEISYSCHEDSCLGSQGEVLCYYGSGAIGADASLIVEQEIVLLLYFIRLFQSHYAFLPVDPDTYQFVLHQRRIAALQELAVLIKYIISISLSTSKGSKYQAHCVIAEDDQRRFRDLNNFIIQYGIRLQDIVYQCAFFIFDQALLPSYPIQHHHLFQSLLQFFFFHRPEMMVRKILSLSSYLPEDSNRSLLHYHDLYYQSCVAPPTSVAKRRQVDLYSYENQVFFFNNPCTHGVRHLPLHQRVAILVYTVFFDHMKKEILNEYLTALHDSRVKAKEYAEAHGNPYNEIPYVGLLTGHCLQNPHNQLLNTRLLHRFIERICKQFLEYNIYTRVTVGPQAPSSFRKEMKRGVASHLDQSFLLPEQDHLEQVKSNIIDVANRTSGAHSLYLCPMFAVMTHKEKVANPKDFVKGMISHPKVYFIMIKNISKNTEGQIIYIPVMPWGGEMELQHGQYYPKDGLEYCFAHITVLPHLCLLDYRREDFPARVLIKDVSAEERERRKRARNVQSALNYRQRKKAKEEALAPPCQKVVLTYSRKGKGKEKGGAEAGALKEDVLEQGAGCSFYPSTALESTDSAALALITEGIDEMGSKALDQQAIQLSLAEAQIPSFQDPGFFQPLTSGPGGSTRGYTNEDIDELCASMCQENTLPENTLPISEALACLEPYYGVNDGDELDLLPSDYYTVMQEHPPAKKPRLDCLNNTVLTKR